MSDSTGTVGGPLTGKPPASGLPMVAAWVNGLYWPAV
jgi:hypothetical protein